MASEIDYKGIPSLDTLPVGPGGSLLYRADRILADRIGPSHKATTAPTAQHDSADTAGVGINFEVNSRWIKTSGGTEEEFVCLANTPNGAVWKSTTSGGGVGGDVSAKADKVSGAAAGNFAGLDSSGNLIDLGYSPAGFSVTGHNHDDRYFTETEVNTLLANKVNTSTLITTAGALTGGGTLAGNLILGINSASASFPGTMSSTHFNMLSTATTNATPSTLVLRDVDGDIDVRDLVVRNITATTINSNISTQKVEVARNNTLVSTRKRVNFIEGSNISITMSDDGANDRTNVTIASVGGASGANIVNYGTIGRGLYWGTDPGNSATHRFYNLYSPNESITLAYNEATRTLNMSVNEFNLDLSLAGGILPITKGGTGANFSGAASGPISFNGDEFEVSPIDVDWIADFYDETRTTVLDIIGDSSTITRTTSPSSPYNTTFDVIPGSSVQLVNMQVNGVVTDQRSTLNFIDDPAGTTTAAVSADGNIGITFAVQEDTSIQKVIVAKNYGYIAARKQINFIEGDNISITTADDPFSNEVRLTINATGDAAGEANTGANTGSGVGVYNTKVGAELRFKSLSAASSRISIVNDGANGEVDFDVPENTANQKLQVYKAGVPVGTRRRINFHEGASITITVADDGVNDEVDVTIAATGSATGEVNTASNIGTGGIGLYHSKSGSDLRFKKLNVGSSKVTLTDDSGNTEIDIDVNEANLVHNNIGGILGLAKGGTNANLSATGGTGQYLKQVTAGGTITVGVIAAADIPSGIDALKIGSGGVTSTEFGYLDGVTSGIQGQLNNKTDVGHGHIAANITDFTEAVQDTVGSFLVDSTTVDFTYTDGSNAITVDVKNNTSTQKVEVGRAGTLIGTRKRINFIEGSNVTIAVTDDGPSDEVDVTISSTGTGGGGGSGTINLGSNVNVGGIGVFKQVVGDALEFRGINSTNSRITVSLDNANNEIDLTFNDNLVDINGLANTLSLAKGGTGTSLSGTGGANQFVKQTTLGGAFSVAAIVAGDVPNNISTQKVEVSLNNGSTLSTRKKLNFIEGGNATVIVADDAANDRVNITIAGVGGGGSSYSASSNNDANTLALRDENGSFDAESISLIGLEVLDHIVSSSGASYAPITIQDITHGGSSDVVRITPTIIGQSATLALRPTFDQTGTPEDWGTDCLVISRTNTFINDEGNHYYIRAFNGGVENFAVSNLGFVIATGLTNNISTQRVEVASSGTLIGTRKRINFIPGTNVTLDVANDVGNDRVNITINSSGGGGGATNLDGLTDVVITSVADGHVLQHNGTNFINRTLTDAGISAIGHTHTSGNITDFTEAVQDVMGAILADSATLDWTYNDGSNTLSAAVIANTTNQRVNVLQAGSNIGTRKTINFIAGTNITYSITDDTPNDRINLTINAGTPSIALDGLSDVSASGASNGDLLVYSSGSGTWINTNLSGAGAAAASHTHSANDLSDVVITSIATGHVLVHNGTNFVNTPLEDAVAPYGTTTIDSASIDFTYDDEDNTLTAVVLPNSTTQRVEVTKNSGAVVGTRKKLNFIEGTNTTITIADDVANDRVNVTVTANAVGLYTALVGNGSATSFIITQATHGRRSDRGNVVQVIEESTGNILASTASVDANGDVTVTISPAPTTNSIRVTILG